ncbi:uncharacterized protein LOC129613997 [Condylostylus longicornis]|uniref:uncharacterized protein LOC129613997 n=1 Tax=Condylostylus longicornis TaxID=2530218 RepID=UPI00244E10F6|nr:uncharacterized protein LOC129613997 [Condylostylus longicornis]
MNPQNTSFSTSTIRSQIIFVIFCVLINCSVYAQRGSYAGSRNGNGYKNQLRPSTEAPQQDIVSRFGEDLNRPQRPPISNSNIVQPAPNFIPINQQPVIDQNPELSNRNSADRLPYDALGDRELVERLNRLPVDQRPFWLINAEAIEAHRNRSGSQANNFNSVAVRGSFAGSGLTSSSLNSNGLQLQQQPKPRPEESVILSRVDLDRTSGSNLIDINRNIPQPSNRISNSLNNEIDSQGGRFIYVGPQLYDALRKANLVI